MPVLQPQTTIRFGIFELDVQARELYRNGVRIRLAPQPLDLLIALLEQPGAVLTREVLQQRLWPPGTFVDYEHGLNKSVRKLREALGDSADSPRYIETVQRSGYRFIAPVIQPDAPTPAAPPDPSPTQAPPSTPASADTTAKPTGADRPTRRYQRYAAYAFLLLLAVATATIAVPRLIGSHSRNTAVPGHDPRAQEAYLHGQYLWFGGHPFAASDYFKRAIEIEPDYGAAWAGMSMYYGATLVNGRIDPTAALGLQQDAAAKALRFAPNLAEVHLAQCGSLFLNTWQYQVANPECERARQLDPANAEIYHFQSKMLAAIHREQDAVEMQRTASRLDSLSKPWAMSQALLQARRYDEAFAEGRARLEAFPHDPRLLYNLALISLYRGNPTQYADFLEQSYRSDGDEASAAQISDAYRSSGVSGIARWKLERLQQQSRTGYVSAFRLATAYMAVGDREQALTQLTIAVHQHAPDLLWIRCYPEFDALGSDPRYQAIARQLPSR
ncbi:winged helix-turn-helix domain-containing protein [Terriglobus aquaticus]|uniref:Winged helix-turn-helix domain-containing protein n=1 Tax=Terriglobus aquaticus TaxID=940139 RepID=A0ABW9KGB5_9BACT|nr:winged helix-turn-helix domain-containing protein [Terriglobus aquaticus]